MNINVHVLVHTFEAEASCYCCEALGQRRGNTAQVEANHLEKRFLEKERILEREDWQQQVLRVYRAVGLARAI